MSVFDLWNPLMPTTSIRSIVWENDGGGGSGGSSGGNVPSFGSLAEASRAGYHGQTVNIEGKGLQNVSFGDKGYDAEMAAASNAANAANTGGISGLINTIKDLPGNIARDISMGLNLTERDANYYSRTAETIARTQGREAANAYVAQMTAKGGIAAEGVRSADIESAVGYGQRFGFLDADGNKQSTNQSDGSDQTDGDQTDGDQTDGEEGDGEEEDTGPPSSMDFRFYGGYQPIARSDVLVPSSFQNRDIYFSNPRLDPIFPQPLPPPPIELFAGRPIDAGMNYDGWLDFYNRQNPNHPDYDPDFFGAKGDEVSGGFDYGDGGFTPGLISGPRMGDTEYHSELLNDPNYRGDGTNFGMVMPQGFAANVTPGPQMPGQGQFSSMQELMEYQQQNPGMNLIGEYQRLRALEGGPPEPVVLPQRGIASLFNEQAPRYMYEGIMG